MNMEYLRQPPFHGNVFLERMHVHPHTHIEEDAVSLGTEYSSQYATTSPVPQFASNPQSISRDQAPTFAVDHHLPEFERNSNTQQSQGDLFGSTADTDSLIPEQGKKTDKNEFSSNNNNSRPAPGATVDQTTSFIENHHAQRSRVVNIQESPKLPLDPDPGNTLWCTLNRMTKFFIVGSSIVAMSISCAIITSSLEGHIATSPPSNIQFVTLPCDKLRHINPLASLFLYNDTITNQRFKDAQIERVKVDGKIECKIPLASIVSRRLDKGPFHTDHYKYDVTQWCYSVAGFRDCVALDRAVHVTCCERSLNYVKRVA